MTQSSHLRRPGPRRGASEFNRFMESVVPVGRLLQVRIPISPGSRCTPSDDKNFLPRRARAEWIQVSGPMRNPWLEREMPDRGTGGGPVDQLISWSLRNRFLLVLCGRLPLPPPGECLSCVY